MNNMIALKLKNGADVVGYLTEENDDYILVEKPVEMQIDPDFGFFAKSYLIFAQGDIARFDKKDLLLLANANEKAISYYTEFSERLNGIQSSRDDFDSDGLEETEDTMVAIIESRTRTKH